MRASSCPRPAPLSKSTKPSETLSPPGDPMAKVPVYAMVLSLLLLSPLGAWSAQGNDGLVVEEGATRVLSAPQRVVTLDVLGTLVVDLPAGVPIEAQAVRVGPHGEIRGLAGTNGIDAQGLDAIGASGADGGSVL